MCVYERDVIEALITQTLQHRNNLMHLLFCQTFPHSFDPNIAQRTPFHMLCSYHAAWFSSSHACKQGQTVVDRGRREAAELPFVYLNIALKSPKPLSVKGKRWFLLLSSLNICPFPAGQSHHAEVLTMRSESHEEYLQSYRPSPESWRLHVTAWLEASYLQHSFVLRTAAIVKLAKDLIYIK